MRFIYLSVLMFVFGVSAANAGFDRWTSEVRSDPFSGGEMVLVNLTTSMRSGVLLMCETAKSSIKVRAIPGYAFTPDMQGQSSVMEFAIDGHRLFSQGALVGSVGDNQVAIEAVISKGNALEFATKFAEAKEQIAIKDGISDRPYLLPARGSTASGAALLRCLQAP